MKKTKQIENMLQDENITFNQMYDKLRDLDNGNWDDINSEEVVLEYVSEKLGEGYRVAHIAEAIQDNFSREELYQIDLGNSMNTPTPINNKYDLVQALGYEC